MKVRALQNDTVDQLCWRHYGKTAGVTEKVLEANPGLSNQIFLNAGQEIEMPVITSEVERVSAVSPNSILPASAILSTPGSAARIASGVKPAIARKAWPLAASRVVKAVSAPSFFA